MLQSSSINLDLDDVLRCEKIYTIYITYQQPDLAYNIFIIEL